MRWLAGASLALALAAAGCGLGSDEEDGELTVFAAASLRDVMADLSGAWVEEHPEAPLTVAAEASNVLAVRISEGAPADIFISADTTRPQELAEAGDTAAEPVPFARNRVTLVTPAEEATVDELEDLAAEGVRIVATSEGAPISRYASEALAQLAAIMPEPDDFSDAVVANTVSYEDNVRAALAKIELGEGDAALVYRTDARSSDAVREIALPAVIDVTAEYAAVQVSDRPLAATFVEWLSGPDAIGVIEAAGFEAPAS